MLAPLVARAQYPRLVLIEEGTNASCEPCAWQSPIFEAFLERDDLAPHVVPLVYHSFWPGPDTMNDRAPEMNDARIRGYYGMIGMPTVVVGGQNYRSATPGLPGGAPADTVALRRLVDSIRSLTTPVRISVRDTIDAASIRIHTDVHTDSAVTGSLRVAVVERYHYYPWPTAGTNGEEHFHWIVRAMPGTAAGRHLALAAGEDASFLDTVAIDPEWNRDELYVVAFVQRDDTREVLQATDTRRRIAVSVRTPTENRSGARVAPGASASFGMLITAPTSYRVRTERHLPPGWTADVVILGRTLPSDTTLQHEGFEPVLGSIVITPADSAPGKGIVRVIISGDHGAVDTAEVRAYAGDIDVPVLAWHAPHRMDISMMYDIALATTEHRYAVVHPDDDDLFTLTDHSLVAIAMGDDTLTPDQRARVRAFLDARGRLLISGSKVAQSLGDPEFDQNGIPRDTAFLHNYLHATYVAPSSASNAVNGLRNDPIGSNVGFVLDAGRRPLGTPDRVRGRRHALPVFHYGSSRDSVGALRYGRPEHRVVFLAFGAEAIADTATRARVLSRSIVWLLGDEITAGALADHATQSSSIRVMPNPAREHARVEIVASGAGRYAVYSMLGEVVERGALVRGANSVALDAGALAAGAYTIVVDVGGERTASAFVVR